MKNFKQKKSLKHKGKGLTQRFSYDIMTPKPLDQEIQKFLRELVSRGVCETSAEKKLKEFCFALRGKKSGWGLCKRLAN